MRTLLAATAEAVVFAVLILVIPFYLWLLS